MKELALPAVVVKSVFVTSSFRVQLPQPPASSRPPAPPPSSKSPASTPPASRTSSAHFPAPSSARPPALPPGSRTPIPQPAMARPPATPPSSTSATISRTPSTHLPKKPIPNLAEIGTIKLRPTGSVKSPPQRETTEQTNDPPWANRNRPPSGEDRSRVPKPHFSRSPEREPTSSEDHKKTPKLPPSRSRPPPPVPGITSSNAINDFQVDGRRNAGTVSPPPRRRNLPPPPVTPSSHNEQNGRVKPPALANRRLPPVPSGDNNPGGESHAGHPSLHRPKPAMAPKPNLAPKPKLPNKPKLPPR